MRRLTQAQIAQRIGVSEGAVSRYEHEEHRLTLPLMRKLAKVLECSIAQLAGEAPMSDAGEISESEFERVPVYDVKASAGFRESVESKLFKYDVLFRREWLRAVTSVPTDKLCVIEASGDSMLPTISNEDQMLVDLTQTTPREDGIYIVRFDDEVLVKRVVIDPVRRKAVLSCDNQSYQPLLPVDIEDLSVAGRVVWIGRRI